MSLCIGLFGTCGNTTWRKKIFIPKYKELNINYFNPQVENWDPKLAKDEAKHLATDEIILFPITKDTYSLGSLGELGFSILNAIKLNSRRDFVVLIDDFIDKSIDYNWDENLINESLKMRTLVREHFFRLNYSNVYHVDDLYKMLEISILLYNNRLNLVPYKKFSLEYLERE